MKQIRIFTILMSISIIIGCSQENPEISSTINKTKEAEELSQILTDFFDAWQSGDADKSVSYMTDDYINMPSLDATQNFQATKEMFQNHLTEYSIESLDYNQTEIFVHTDMAYEFGWLDQTWIRIEHQDTIYSKTRCITVWKKLEDGTWKLHRWMAQ